MKLQKLVNLLSFVIISIVSLGLTGPVSHVSAQQPIIIRVIPEGKTSINCGNDWINGCDLQYALSTRTGTANNNPWEIWVKQGIYVPTSDPTKRSASFQLKNNVALYGGFQGSEVFRGQRSWQNNPSILSGDIDKNDLASPADTYLKIVGSNAFHVINGSGTDSTAILDGFTISAGFANATSYDDQTGGGINIWGGNPTLANLLIIGNRAVVGGGMNNESSSPSIMDVAFEGNFATWGGGMFNDHDSSPVMENISFVENKVNYQGGGMCNFYNSSPRITNTTFYRNSSDNFGGATYNLESSPVFVNVTMYDNAAPFGANMYNDRASSKPIVKNSIVWGLQNSNVYNSDNSEPVISFSDVQMENGVVYPGDGNKNEDPLLGVITPAIGATKVFPLLPGSPAIDTGNNANCPLFDQRGISRPQGSLCDMGAFEVFQGKASKIKVVPQGSVNPDCGNTWTNGCDLQYALTTRTNAVDDSQFELWVKQGTYYPTAMAGERSASFQMKNNVSMYGGFQGTEDDREQRDWKAFPSILSGDIDHNDQASPASLAS